VFAKKAPYVCFYHPKKVAKCKKPALTQGKVPPAKNAMRQWVMGKKWTSKKKKKKKIVQIIGNDRGSEQNRATIGEGAKATNSAHPLEKTLSAIERGKPPKQP